MEGLERFDRVICVTLRLSHQGSECPVCKGKGLGLGAILGSKGEVAPERDGGFVQFGCAHVFLRPWR